MNNSKILAVNVFLISTILLLNPFFVEAQEKPSSIEERLIRLEEGQKALNQRIDDTNKRIDELRDSLRQEMTARFAAVDQSFASINQRLDDMNKRFDDINKRFGDLQFWLQLVFGVVALMLAGLIAHWLLMWRRLIKIETKVEEHLAEAEKDRLIAFQREEIEMLKAKLDKLETES